jgi:hypothetical protein
MNYARMKSQTRQTNSFIENSIEACLVEMAYYKSQAMPSRRSRSKPLCARRVKRTENCTAILVMRKMVFHTPGSLCVFALNEGR